MKMTIRERMQGCIINFHAWNRLAGAGTIRVKKRGRKSCWILLTATEKDGRHAAPNTIQLANAMMGGNTTCQCNDCGIQIIG
jgi:hypothetical protein